MLKNSLLIIFLLFLPANVMAKAIPYWSLHGKLLRLENSNPVINGAVGTTQGYENGFGFGSALGYQFDKSPYRIELEVGYNSNKADIPAADTDFLHAGKNYRSLTGMANIFIDYPRYQNVSAYFGTGLGAAYVATDNVNDNSVAYQFMAGLNLHLDSGDVFYAGGRYFDVFNSPEFQSANGKSGEYSYQYSALEVGYRMLIGTPKKQKASYDYYDEPEVVVVEPKVLEVSEVRGEQGFGNEPVDISPHKRTYESFSQRKQAEPPAHKEKIVNEHNYRVSAGFFRRKEYARKASYLLKDIGKSEIKLVSKGDVRLYEVRLGDFGDIQDAEYTLEKAYRMGYRDASIVRVKL